MTVLGRALVAATVLVLVGPLHVAHAGGRPPRKPTLYITPRCFVYGHQSRANITLTGVRPYERIEFDWAVRNKFFTGREFGPGTHRANAAGVIHVSYPAPTQYDSDIARWVLGAFDLRGNRIAHAFFRVVPARCS